MKKIDTVQSVRPQKRVSPDVAELLHMLGQLELRSMDAKNTSAH